MTIFVMDAETGAKLHKVSDYAEQHRIALPEMRARHEAFIRDGRVDALPDGHQTILPNGFKVVFSIEEHPAADGSGGVWLRHMSMSSPRQGRAPIEQALEWVMGQLGYTSPLRSCMVYPEDIGPDAVAINVIEEYHAPVQTTVLS